MFFRLVPYDTVHLSHSGIPPQLWAHYQGGKYAGDDPKDEMVGLGRETRIWWVDGYYGLMERNRVGAVP